MTSGCKWVGGGGRGVGGGRVHVCDRHCWSSKRFCLPRTCSPEGHLVVEVFTHRER